MRSNSTKQQMNTNLFKGKKVMEFASLISTYQQDKNKSNVDKKNPTNKPCNNKKILQGDQISSDIRKNLNEKTKPYMKSDNQIKRHHRSKTQNFDQNPQQSSTLDLFRDIQLNLKINVKKNDLKRQESKKRMKTESLKRLNPSYYSKTSEKQLKPYFNPIIDRKSDSSKQKKQKALKKKQVKQNQEDQSLMQTTKLDLQVLKGKFKKQKLNSQTQNRRQNTSSMKSQKKNKNKEDSKNLTLLNLSQILHRNEYENSLYPEQKQTSKRQLKSNRSQSRKLKIGVNKRKQLLKDFSQKIDHLTSSVNQQMEQNQLFKKVIQKDSKESYKFDARSFSFMNQRINQEMKHGKSNFSTGVDSIGLDEENQQLLKLKLNAQRQINYQISKNIKEIKLSYLVNSNYQRSDLQGLRNIETTQTGEKSSRTFYQNNPNVDDQKREEILLLQLIQKYNNMTGNLLPVIYDFKSVNPEQLPLLTVLQKSIVQERQTQKKHNQKYIEKFNQLAHKNTVYQQIINALIKDGVNVQKYIHSYFKDKK